MTQEPPKSNAVLIIIAVIGVLGTIIASTISVIGSYNVEKLRQETELTRIALVSIATQGGATQISMGNTLSAPTNTLNPDFLNTLQATYTPYPTYTQSIIPILSTSTNTPEPNLIFEDNFDNGIDSQYWQTFGTWAVSNGVPILVERHKSDYRFNYSAFDLGGGLIFPGTAGMDNIAIEFDYLDSGGMAFLFSFVDEYNYKVFSFVTQSSGREYIDFFRFANNGEYTQIPNSQVRVNFSRPSRIRVELHGNSLKVLVDNQTLYDFMNLPSAVTGAIGFQGNENMHFDNFKIYQLQ